jgi:hypothetical protein
MCKNGVLRFHYEPLLLKKKKKKKEAQHSKTLEEKQSERVTAHRPRSQRALAVPLPSVELIVPQPWYEVLQQWPVAAWHGTNRCSVLNTLLQDEERH